MENGRLEKHSTSSTAARPAPTFITARPDSICTAICILQTSSCSNATLCNGLSKVKLLPNILRRSYT